VSHPGHPDTAATSRLLAALGRDLATFKHLLDCQLCRVEECYALPMRPTELVLDEELLEEVTKISGETSSSKAVTRALEEFVHRHRRARILDLAGTGLWEGDLAEMREDAPSPARSRAAG
jgi:Arc/MetJ family transcription regulator